MIIVRTYHLLMGDFNNNAFIRNEGYDYLISKGLNDLYLNAEKKMNAVLQ